MSAKVPTFEEVDKHIQSADLTAFQKGGKQHLAAASATADRAAAIPNICGAYKMVRPILLLVAGVQIIPKKWRDALKAFVALMDAFCP